MIQKIKQELIKFFNNENIEFEELKNPSKNQLYLVRTPDKKFILKVYKSRENKENIKSYEREKTAINYFSSHIDEIIQLVCSKEGDTPWILMKFFEGPSLKSTGNFELYKKAIFLMTKLHSLKCDIEKPSEIEIIGVYDKKLQEVRERIKKYLPRKYNRNFLINLVDNFYLTYRLIYENSNKMIHGDFVDRNILVNGELILIDFENSRFAPLVEDFIFFLENSKLKNEEKEELTKIYKNEIPYNEKIFLILTLLTKLRILGSLLRIKKDKLKQFDDRIKSYIKEIIDLSSELKEKHDLDLTKKDKEDWDEIFSSKGTFFNEIHNDLKYFVEELDKEDIILDLGSGSGRHTVYLAAEGFNVTGIDAAKKGIEITKKLLDERNLTAELICKNFYDGLPFEDNSYDCIISTQAIHHNRLYEIKKLIDEIKRVLKSEGKIFITVPKLKNISYKDPLEIEKNTFIPTKGHEQGVIHHYFDIIEIKKFFSNFDIKIKEDDYNHYLIVGHIFKRIG